MRRTLTDSVRSRQTEHRTIPDLAESFLLMGTTVTIRVVGEAPEAEKRRSIASALEAMRTVETACSRFDEDSALRELCRQPGRITRVPDVLFHALQIALEVSELTGGVFDPAVGRTLVQQGFNRHYLTGETISSDVWPDEPATYRDITLVEEEMSVVLHKPMLLDLGAVAKGLAVDLAARELAGWEGFAIDAGGDVYVQGGDPEGEPWMVGIQHPRRKDAMITWLRATDVSICTSGDYERRSPLHEDVHHLWNPVTGASAQGLVSCTVVAPLAVLADAVSTAAFLLGPDRAIDFVDDLDLAALCVKDDLTLSKTRSMGRYLL